MLGHGVQDTDCFQIDEEAVVHAIRLVRISLLQVIQFNPVSRILVIDFAGQLVLELSVLVGLQGNQKRDQFTPLRRL